MTSVPAPVLISLDRVDAELLRRWLAALLDGRPDDYIPALAPLLKALESEGVVAPTRVRCPDEVWDGMVGGSNHHQCEERLFSEDALYLHLRTVHRYPEEDAGSSASRAWRNR